jgi:SPP1 family predicted phage head-tail adaptor
MRLDTLIKFYEPVFTKTDSGHEKIQYRELTTAPSMFAELVTLGNKGRERDEGKQRVASTTVEFNLRYRSDINQKMVILAEGKYHDIIRITPIRRMQFLTIEAEEKDNDWQLDLFTA